MGNTNIKILIADDHRMMRDGLRLAIQRVPDLEVIGEADNGPDVVRQAEKLNPDIMILDIHLPGKNGIEVAREILGKNRKTRIIVLSADADPGLVRSAVEAGVSGYLVKENAVNELIQAIHAATRSMSYFSPEIATALARQFCETPTRPSTPALSERERQVLSLLTEGLRSKEIAARLNLSPKSVETYRSRLMQKLGYSSTAELIRFAIREGIAEL